MIFSPLMEKKKFNLKKMDYLQGIFGHENKKHLQVIEENVKTTNKKYFNLNVDGIFIFIFEKTNLLYRLTPKHFFFFHFREKLNVLILDVTWHYFLTLSDLNARHMVLMAQYMIVLSNQELLMLLPF